MNRHRTATRALLGFAVAASGCAHAGAGAQQAGPGPAWRELRTAHVSLATDLDPARARETILQLEFVRTALAKILGAELPSRPLDVVAFSRASDYAPFQPNADALAHFYADSDGEERVVMWAYLDQARRIIVSHELAHHVAYHAVPRQPQWFAEGLASFLASDSEVLPSWVYTAGTAPHEGYLEMWYRRPVKAEEVLAWSGSQAKSAPLYVRSWVLVHFLSHRRPDGFRALQKRLAAGEHPRQAWNRAFPEWSLDVPGATDALDRELTRYQTSPPSDELNVQVEPETHVTERMLSPAEVRDLRLGLRRFNGSAGLDEEVAAALAADPAHVRALMIRAERTPAEATALARRAVEAHPESALAWAFLGRSGLPPGDHAARAEAFRKALDRTPDDPAHALDLAAELIALARPSEALPLIEEAERAVPFTPTAPYYRAWALAGLGRCAEASASVRRAQGLAHEDSPISEAEVSRIQGACAGSTGQGR